MSRIGERKLVIPDGVTVNVDGTLVTVKGPKGELNLEVSKLVSVVVEDGVVLTKQIKPNKEANVMQGTTNSLISNMITGVSKGYDKGLEAVGVGYRFQVSGNKITINAGYSHPVEMIDPEGIETVLDGQNKITVKGIDKEKVGQFAAEIRDKRRPEPYKGKGIKYADEVIRRKVGKTGKK